jgi:hypothetical protein
MGEILFGSSLQQQRCSELFLPVCVDFCLNRAKFRDTIKRLPDHHENGTELYDVRITLDILDKG